MKNLSEMEKQQGELKKMKKYQVNCCSATANQNYSNINYRITYKDLDEIAYRHNCDIVDDWKMFDTYEEAKKYFDENKAGGVECESGAGVAHWTELEEVECDEDGEPLSRESIDTYFETYCPDQVIADSVLCTQIGDDINVYFEGRSGEDECLLSFRISEIIRIEETPTEKSYENQIDAMVEKIAEKLDEEFGAWKYDDYEIRNELDYKLSNCGVKDTYQPTEEEEAEEWERW